MSARPTDPTAPSASERREGSLAVAREVLRTETRALAKLAEELDEAAFAQALDVLLACEGRIVTTGMGKSGIIARKIAGTLASTGSPAFFLHPAEAGHGDLGMIVDGDVVVALSHSGETAEVVALLPAVRRLGASLIALVGERDSTLGTEADVMLHVGIDAEACPLGLAPTASTTAALALGDALAMALLNERGFGSDEFARFHPRGSLGRRLVRVRDVMHAGDRMPSVPVGTTLAEAVGEMSAKTLGMTIVTDEGGHVAGVVTDGDLRRAMQRGVTREATVAECMTTGPATIGSEALASEALHLLEERRITSLVVVGAEGLPIGVVHLHDLWRTQMV